MKKQMNKIPELHDKVLKQAKSEKLGQYVWKYGTGPQMGYSFSVIHALAYSFIGVQTLYIATNWNPIYWDTACLIVNSGSLEDNSEIEIVDIYEPEHQELLEGTTFEDLPDRSAKIKKTSSTDYGKIAKAMGEMISAGIKVSLVDINNSGFSFKPDAKNNQILYGMKGLLNVSDAIIEKIIENRPYDNPKDFLLRVKPNKQAMVSLIKGGAFDNMMDRKTCMAWYIWETCDKKKRITLQNMGGLIKHNLLPEKTEEQIMARRIYEFNRYLKAVCLTANKLYYILDTRALNFIQELGCEEILHFNSENEPFCFPKDWDKIYQSWMDIFRNWIAEEKETILQNLNESIFMEEWNKYASGNISSWEMEALCFYYHDHELKNVDVERYGLVDFNNLPEEPVIDRVYKKKNGEIKIFKLYKICGTCIAKNKPKSTVSLLTTSGVVNVKMSKEFFSMFDKQISERGEDGVKHVIQKSWFNRGNMIVVQGIRSGDDFIAKKYQSTGGHQLYRIEKIFEDGSLVLADSRPTGISEDEID